MGNPCFSNHIDIMDLISDFYRFAANNEIADRETEKDIGQLYSHLMDMDPAALRVWILERSLEYRSRLNCCKKQFYQKLCTESAGICAKQLCR